MPGKLNVCNLLERSKWHLYATLEPGLGHMSQASHTPKQECNCQYIGNRETLHEPIGWPLCSQISDIEYRGKQTILLALK